MGQAYVAGIGITKLAKYDGAYAADLAMEAIAAALADARLPTTDIEGIYTSPQGFLRHRERFITQRIAQRLDLAPKAIVEMDAGGTTAGLTFQSAVRAIESGQIRCGLVYASEVELEPED